MLSCLLCITFNRTLRNHWKLFQRLIALSRELQASVIKTMIETADEFARLRNSDQIDEQTRATHDSADINVWLDVINKFPDLKTWIIHNKTIQIEILELLSTDKNSEVRSAVARKRKINDKIFQALSADHDENVRFALICNTNLSVDKIKTIKVDDSNWLTQQLTDRLKNASL